MTNLLQLTQRPLLSADEQQRLAAMIEQAGDGDAFVGMFSPGNSLCITAGIVGGEVMTWHIFPAAGEAQAQSLALLSREVFQRMLQRAADEAQSLGSLGRLS